LVKFNGPIVQWALLVLTSVLMGTCLLVAVAFFRRWQQIRYVRYVHSLQRRYRPIVAELLSGTRGQSGIDALRDLPLAEVELLLDPLFSRRKLPERCLVFLQVICSELGLIDLWHGRLSKERGIWSTSSGGGYAQEISDRAVMRSLLRAKSIRNLGKLRHQPSWPLLVSALDDRHVDIQEVALRSLAALGAPESFPALCNRLHTAAQSKSPAPPLQGLQAAMVDFSLACVPALLPSLRHPDFRVRMRATEILKTMICRQAARQPGFTLRSEVLTVPMVELLLTGLAVDTSAEIRARMAEVLVFLPDPRVQPVLCALLRDRQWFVRLRSVRAVAQLRHAATPLFIDIRDRLNDPHWRVREAATQTLLSLGQKGRLQLYEYFLISMDPEIRKQIVEVIERTGLMSVLVEEYGQGAIGMNALVVEQLASEAAPLGLSGVLRTLRPDIRQRFLDRFLPYAEAKMRFLEEKTEEEKARSLQQALEFPPHLAA